MSYKLLVPNFFERNCFGSGYYRKTFESLTKAGKIVLILGVITFLVLALMGTLALYFTPVDNENMEYWIFILCFNVSFLFVLLFCPPYFAQAHKPIESDQEILLQTETELTQDQILAIKYQVYKNIN